MAAGETTNPYLAGVHATDNATATFRNDRYLRIANNAKNWRLGFFGLLLCTSGLAGGLVYVTSTQQVIPSVVEVDAAGSARAMQELRATSVEDPVVVQALLGKWLQDVRTLTSRRTGAGPRREHDGLAPFARTHAYTSVLALRISRVGRTCVAAAD